MIYRQLFERAKSKTPVRAGIIGTGQYATAIVTQAQAVPRLEVLAVADVNINSARQAYRLAGLSNDNIVVCETRDTALRAIEQSKSVIVPDATLLMDLPLDVIVESTGNPEAGAQHVWEAIQHGKHVAMVNKETDIVVGPILKRLADQAGVVYTAVDGDQPSLLIGLTLWAQELGLEVLCAGKANEFDLILNSAEGTLSYDDRTVKLGKDDAELFQPMPTGNTAGFVQARDALWGSESQSAGYCAELMIVANATRLAPDDETLHWPILRTSEIPDVLCPEDEGGILRHRGVIDGITCLRQPHEAGMGGGVFVVVACHDDYSRRILTAKGLVTNRSGSAMLIYRPYHLCGVETVMSILCAGLLGVPTGACDLSQRFDVIVKATQASKAGEQFGDQTNPKWKALMRAAQPVKPGNPLPYFMAEGRPLVTDISADTVLTTEMITVPSASILWSLRAQQDKLFFRGETS